MSTHRLGHHNLVVSIECKDHGRKIDVPHIDAFRTKCERTGINQGVVVSRLGFTKAALESAESFNIRCITLRDIEKLDWCLAQGFASRLRGFRDVKVRVDFGVEPSVPWTLFHVDGSPISPKILESMLHTAINSMPPDQHWAVNDGVKIRVDVEDPQSWKSVLSTGEEYVVTKAFIAATVHIVETFVPLSFHSYRDEKSQEAISTAARGVFSAGNNKFAITIAGRPDGTKGIIVSNLGPTKSDDSTTKAGRRARGATRKSRKVLNR